ncbi:MAG: aminopeptidase [Armatimonadetes bacterium]|nr:aminopeptidase [Armatimonadota bacterium]
MDPRIEKLANVLVQYSLEVKPGQLVRISGNAVAQPLILAAYRAVLRDGAHPVVRATVDGLDEAFYREANEEQLRFVPELQRKEIEAVDATLGIWAETNTRALTSVDPARRRIRGDATRPLSQRLLARAAEGTLRWVGTQYPTHAHAQEADMSLDEYANFVYGAGHLDDPDPIATWRRIHAEQERIVARLNQCRELRVVGPDTDLTVSVAGRTWINCAGDSNFPDGEVFTAPDETSTRGHIRFSFPAIYGGREVSDVRLVFESGRVVKAEAAKGEDFLRQMLAMDDGAKVLGEFAIGTNYDIQRFTKNILFDEKIGGTVHMALGSSYPESGGKNTSGLHWDMICDLRDGGEICADGEVIHKDGKFLIGM